MVPKRGSRVRLTSGLPAPRPLDLCRARTAVSVAFGCLLFILRGDTTRHDWLTQNGQRPRTMVGRFTPLPRGALPRRVRQPVSIWRVIPAHQSCSGAAILHHRGHIDLAILFHARLEQRTHRPKKYLGVTHGHRRLARDAGQRRGAALHGS